MEIGGVDKGEWKARNHQTRTDSHAQISLASRVSIGGDDF
jgi:hypothetical protein